MSQSEMNSDRFLADARSKSTTPKASSRSASQSPQDATDSEPEIVELDADAPSSPTTPKSPEAESVPWKCREMGPHVGIKKTVPSAPAAETRPKSKGKDS